MTVLIAIPVFRVFCGVGVDKGRGWSVIEELVLWSTARQSKSIRALSNDSGLPSQIVIAAIARLMRFRLVEVALTSNGAEFRASEYGFKAISGGNPLPFFPTRIKKRASFTIEWATGDFFHTRDLSIMSVDKLGREQMMGSEVRTISVEGGGPSMSHEANLRRLSDIVAGGWNEEVATVDARTAVLRDDEFMIVRVIDGNLRGLPERAGPALRKIVADAAALPAGSGPILVGYAGPRDHLEDPTARPCTFDFSDLVIGGSQQRDCFLQLLSKANRRVIIHSTFLDAKRFEVLLDPIKSACRNGVTFDLFWGDELDDEKDNRNARAAAEIARIVRDDPETRGNIRMHMRSTGSHAKLMLVDTQEGWIAAIGSCNWLSSPFQSVELTAVLRDSHVVADIAVSLQRMVGRRGLADNIATEMAVTARDLRKAAVGTGEATISIVAGETHDRIIRTASGTAARRFLIGSNRLGSTARPGAVMQGEVAASRPDVCVTVLYTQTTGPLKNRHAKALAEETAANGVRLVRTRKIPLHGKLLAWDDDDVVVTSLNWASASADLDFPWRDIGVHITAPGLAGSAFDRLVAIFPELAAESQEVAVGST